MRRPKVAQADVGSVNVGTIKSGTGSALTEQENVSDGALCSSKVRTVEFALWRTRPAHGTSLPSEPKGL